MGRCKNHALNKRAQQIWVICQEYKDAEWTLNPKILNEARKILSFQPQIYCCATAIMAIII